MTVLIYVDFPLLTGYALMHNNFDCFFTSMRDYFFCSVYLFWWFNLPTAVLSGKRSIKFLL